MQAYGLKAAADASVVSDRMIASEALAWYIVLHEDINTHN